jgi:hypothetical protein
MASVRAAYPEKNINEEVSEYYIAEEISTTYNGMEIAVPDEQCVFREGTVSEMAAVLLELSSRMDLSKFKKHKRGPKKPPLPKTKHKWFQRSSLGTSKKFGSGAESSDEIFK